MSHYRFPWLASLHRPNGKPIRALLGTYRDRGDLPQQDCSLLCHSSSQQMQSRGCLRAGRPRKSKCHIHSTSYQHTSQKNKCINPLDALLHQENCIGRSSDPFSNRRSSFFSLPPSRSLLDTWYIGNNDNDNPSGPGFHYLFSILCYSMLFRRWLCPRLLSSHS